MTLNQQDVQQQQHFSKLKNWLKQKPRIKRSLGKG